MIGNITLARHPILNDKFKHSPFMKLLAQEPTDLKIHQIDYEDLDYIECQGLSIMHRGKQQASSRSKIDKMYASNF